MILPIRIMERDFTMIGEVKRYSSLQITRSWHGIGKIELRINRYFPNADKLTMGRIIIPHDQTHKASVILHREIELDEKGKATENWIIRALSLKAWLGERLTWPPVHTGYDNKTGDAESVMHHYVNNNVINPLDPGDKISDIVLESNQNRGMTVSRQSRFKVLAEEVASISVQSGLGWNVEADLDNERFVFKVLEGRDLTENLGDRPSAIFSTQNKTLKQLSYTESELDYKNYAVVAGQGEGVDRRIVTVGNATGKDRRVLFVDARDVAEEIEYEDGREPTPRPVADIEQDLRNRGLQKLAEHEQEFYVEGQALSASRLKYGIHYDLGDLVTLQKQEWGVSVDASVLM